MTNSPLRRKVSGLRLLNRTFWSPLGTHLRSALVLRWETSKIRSDTLDKIGESGSLRKRGATFAVRNLLDTSLEVRELANSEVVRRLVEAVLGPGSFAVQGILFDKIPDVNWKVPWHQDVTIAIQEKVEAEGFGPWSIKADVLNVQPPAFVLEQMISVRFHLDPCGEANGALRVIPGSHLQGRIPEEEINRIREEVPERICAGESRRCVADATVAPSRIVSVSGTGPSPSRPSRLRGRYASEWHALVFREIAAVYASRQSTGQCDLSGNAWMTAIPDMTLESCPNRPRHRHSLRRASKTIKVVVVPHHILIFPINAIFKHGP